MSFLEVSPAADHVVVSSRCCTGLVRVGLNFPLNGTCANVYAHVVVVRVHVWRTLCSVCAYGARVAQSNLSFLEVSRAPIAVVVSTRCLIGLVRVGLKFPLNGTCANVHAHVVVVRVHVWRTLCSVCATGARVAQSFLSNLWFHECFSGAVTLLIQHGCFSGNGTGRFELPT